MQISLQQRQLAEVVAAFSELAPTDVLRRRAAEEAAEEAEKLATFQASMTAARDARLRKAREDKEAFEANLRAANDAELARIDAEHAAQLEAERSRSEAALAARRERLREEQEALKAQALVASGALDMAARDAIVAEFDANNAAVEAKLDAVRAQQKAKTEAALAARRIKQRAKAEAQLVERAAEEEARAAAAAAQAAAAAKAQMLDAKARAEAAATSAAAANAGADAAGAAATTAAVFASAAAAVLREEPRASPPRAQSQHAMAGGDAESRHPAGVGRSVSFLGPAPAVGTIGRRRSSAEGRTQPLLERADSSRHVQHHHPEGQPQQGGGGGGGDSGGDARAARSQLADRMSRIEALMARLVEAQAAAAAAAAAAAGSPALAAPAPTPHVVYSEAPPPPSQPPAAAAGAALTRQGATLLAQLAGLASTGGPPPAAAGTPASRLAPVPDASLLPRQALRLEYGRALLAAMLPAAAARPPTVTLSAAADLPPMGAPPNPRQPGYGVGAHFFVSTALSSAVVYVRLSLLDSAGELALALCHAAAVLAVAGTGGAAPRGAAAAAAPPPSPSSPAVLAQVSAVRGLKEGLCARGFVLVPPVTTPAPIAVFHLRFHCLPPPPPSPGSSSPTWASSQGRPSARTPPSQERAGREEAAAASCSLAWQASLTSPWLLPSWGRSPRQALPRLQAALAKAQRMAAPLPPCPPGVCWVAPPRCLPVGWEERLRAWEALL